MFGLTALALATPGIQMDLEETELSDHVRHRLLLGNPLLTPPVLTPMVLPPVSDGPDRMVYGYLAYWDADLQTVPWDDLSHVAMFSADVDTAGNLSNTGNWSQTENAVAIGAPYGVEIHLAVTNFSSSELEILLGSVTARANLITQLADWEASTGAHGINIDFENMPASRRAEMAQFIADLDAAVGDVVVATPAVDWSNAWDFASLTDHSTLFLMGYGYHWSGSDIAGPTDPLFSGPGTVWTFDRALDRSLADYVTAGADPDRLILGLPLYGRAYSTTSNAVPSNNNADGGPVFWGDAMTDMLSWPGIFEPTGQSVYYYDGTHQHWVNDVSTLQARVQYADSQGVAGVGFWALNYDDEDAALWAMIHDETAIVTPTPPPPTVTPPTVTPPTITPPPATPPPVTPPPTGQDDPVDEPEEPPAENEWVARVGDPLLAYAGDTVVLNGEASTGPDPIVYRWVQVSGPEVELDAYDIAAPSFQLPASGNYAFQLDVGTGIEFSSPTVAHVVGIDRSASRVLEPGGCGCSSGGGAMGTLWVGVFGAVMLRRRQRSPAR